MSIRQLLFSFKGRISRKTYWSYSLVIYGLSMFLGVSNQYLLGINDQYRLQTQQSGITVIEIVFIIEFILLIFLAWIDLAIQIKRWHDLNKSWVWIFIAFVPVIGWLWKIIDLGFIAGSEEENKYGTGEYDGDPAIVEQKKRTTSVVMFFGVIINILVIGFVYINFFSVMYAIAGESRNNNINAGTQSPKPGLNATEYWATKHAQRTPTPRARTTASPISGIYTEPWRVPMMPEKGNNDYDTTAPASWKDFHVKHARNLAIEKPYRWEIYELPRGYKFSDITEYYIPIMTKKGFRIGLNDYDPTNLTGVINFVRDSRKMTIEFWTEDSENLPLVLVIYKNFE